MANRDFEFPDVKAPRVPRVTAPDVGPKIRAMAGGIPDEPAVAEPASDLGALAEVLQAGGDVDLYLARHRPRRVTSVPATYRIPLDLLQMLKAWVGEDPEHRTSTGLIVALLDAWGRDSGREVGR